MSGPRIAIIGCGAIAQRVHIPALLAAGAQISVLASRTESSAVAAREVAGLGEVTTDWRAAIARQDVDAVVVCTPNALHAPVAIAAARAGRHVLVEKPFATTLAEADEMIAAAAGSGTVLMAAHNLRFAPVLTPVRAAVSDGAIGTVRTARMSFCHAGPQAWAPDAHWFRDAQSAGGGALIDLGVHAADTLHFLLDDQIMSVAASVDQVPVDEDALVSFRTRKGVLGSFHAGWRSHAGPDQTIVIHGDAGTIHFDATSGVSLHRTGEATRQLGPATEVDDPCAAFVRAISGGEPASPSAADGRAALAVVLAAYDAAATGTWLEVAHP